MAMAEAEEAEDLFICDRLSPREGAGEREVAFADAIEWKQQVCLLFEGYGKQSNKPLNRAVRDVCDRIWVREQFRGLLHLPRYALIKTCRKGEGAHRDFPFHPLIYEGKLYTKHGYEGDIRVTNSNDDGHITTLTGHISDIWCLIIDDGKLYSASSDSTIKIWSCSTDTLITTLTGHTSWVTCLTIDDGKLYSGGGYPDNSIKVWNCSDHKLITTLGRVLRDDGSGEYKNVGHTYAVKCLTIHGGKLYSGSQDSTIKVWSCSTNELITTLTGHTSWVYCLTIHGGKLYSGGDSGAIKVWNCSDDSLITTLRGHTGSVYCLRIHDGHLYSGSTDNTIKVHDCSDDSHITTLRGHKDWVVDFTFQNGKLYSKDAYGTITIWQL